MRPHLTARQAGLLNCHVCGQLARAPAEAAGPPRCPRCAAPLHLRKPASITTTWALILAAALLYLPANLLPIMVTTSLVNHQVDTIMSGVIFLWVDGQWPLAVVVFFASVVVPLLKILALTHLTASVQRRSRHRTLQRARLYRLVEFVGRWSMLDIYVITLLVALVQFRGLATVEAGPAAVAFGAVVVLTMFAALTFDPRLIWDPLTDSEASDHD
ncbi:paraquat-inducible protein A [Zoogloea sp. LCSB751]|uniref:paraquat-inducible protein A n=1 Tax=Zoogloea sp. LCSB751 TaxID=1965277 RepID=UPI0009A528CC|nr:paraquat-inducible protein A [Zoogloea sp. LCSB751]